MTTASLDDTLGPVDHLVIEFPDGQISIDGFTQLMDLVDRRMVFVLDLEFVQQTDDGAIRILDAADIASDEQLAVLAGANVGLLDEDDLHTIGQTLQPGSVAAVLIFENLWVAPMLSAFRGSGGQILSENRVPVEDLLVALDRMDATDTPTSG